jgi:molybdopterin/thiamine biosynthesis adenylyltransferase/nitroreductase
VTVLRVPTGLPPWREVMKSAERESWHPLCFDRRDPTHLRAMEELMASGEVQFIHDLIDAQIADLIRTRNPHANFSDAEQAERVTAHMGETAAQDYGRWLFFPWSKHLVHLLGPEEFFEVRSDRNRNKITREEQVRLGQLRVALAGLSVGNAIANTLALEGVFGELRLADFDVLDLSNMNRIRCAVHQIGINKAIIAARQIFEQNPYANLVLFTAGVTPDNLDEFLDGVDLVLDECDSMYIKIKLREAARARKLPVIMETSDRGMLDIERFDLEPDRPILHGVLGGMSSDDLLKLPPAARLGVVLRIVDSNTMSTRAAASLLELGRTLRAFSQLGSDVTLGGATTTAAVRRFGLGLPLASGRVFVDVSAQLADVPPLAAAPWRDPEAVRQIEVAAVRKLVEAAVRAPSFGNSQPWRFVYRGGALYVHHDPARTGGPNDELGRQMAHIAIGAALENMDIVAGAGGQSTAMVLFPTPGDPTLVAELRLSPRPGGAQQDPLVEEIGRRMTNRRPGIRPHLTPVHAQVLASAARERGAKLQLCNERQVLDGLTQVLTDAERLRMLCPVLHAELMQSLRWTLAEAEQTRDGMPVESYATSPADVAILQLARSPQVARLLRDVGGGTGLAATVAPTIASSAAVGLLTIPGTDPAAFVRGGRAMQQMWLTASALGLALHPINTLVAMFARVERHAGAGLDPQEVAAVVELRERFSQFFTVSMSDAEVLLFRLSYTDGAPERSMRRDIDDAFSVA